MFYARQSGDLNLSHSYFHPEVNGTENNCFRSCIDERLVPTGFDAHNRAVVRPVNISDPPKEPEMQAAK